MIKKTFAIVLILIVFSTFFVPLYASGAEGISEEEAEALKTAAINAHKLYALSDWRLAEAIITPENAQEMDRFNNAIAQDPVFSLLFESTVLYRKTDFGYDDDYVYYYRTMESFRTIKDLQDFFDSYFTGFDVETQYPEQFRFFDDEHRLYLSTNVGFWGFGGCEYFDYSSLSVERIDERHANVTIVHRNDTYPEEDCYEDRLIMVKTETGWKAESVDQTQAPATGDNTAFFVVLSLVTFAVFSITLVLIKKKLKY